jgi:catechol-2,3-dioxygenase
MLNQPFKVRRLGHFRFNLVNLEASAPFYRDLLGFRVTDPRADGGFFGRYGSDHHAILVARKPRFHSLAAQSRRPARDDGDVGIGHGCTSALVWSDYALGYRHADNVEAQDPATVLWVRPAEQHATRRPWSRSSEQGLFISWDRE